MNHLEFMRQSRDKTVVGYQDFLREYSGDKDIIYCFVEGKDDVKYYNPKLHQILSFDVELRFYPCKGKTGLLRIFDFINQDARFENDKILYFVDRDFDESVVITNRTTKIYETPCYSIENFYTSNTCFSRILQSEFYLNKGSHEYEVVMELFKERQIEWHDNILELNSWIACHRDLSNREISNNIVYRLNLDDNFNPENYSIVNLQVSTINNLNYILTNAFPHAIGDVDELLLEAKVKQFRTIERQKWFRGKFEIFFLKKFLSHLSNEGNKKSSNYLPKRLPNMLKISGNILSELCQYADVPECLKDYVLEMVNSKQVAS